MNNRINVEYLGIMSLFYRPTGSQNYLSITNTNTGT